MRHRPWPLIILAILHILSPLVNVLMSGWFQGISMAEAFKRALDPTILSHNALIMILPVIAGFAIYACKKWSFYLYLLCMAGMFFAIHKDLVGLVGPMFMLDILIIYMVNIFIVVYFLIPQVRKIYFDKKMRWWENKPRYSFQQPCHFKKINSDKTNAYQGDILDISEGGLFLKSDVLKPGSENIEITFRFMDYDYHFVGRTIFHDRTDIIGFGVEFEHTPTSKNDAKKIVNHLKEQGAETRSKPRYEDTFQYWLKNLLKTGNGLVPKTTKKN